jgi:sulfoacetaldehyde dehydrogenase
LQGSAKLRSYLELLVRGFSMSEAQSPAQEVAEMMSRARAAQAQIADYTQEQVDELITAMVYAVAREDRSEEIARFTVEETQLGNYEGKYLKIHRKTRATLMDIIDDKSVGLKNYRNAILLRSPSQLV